MSRLIKISGWDGTPRASVIFVHGLGGHAYDTWRRDARRKEAQEDVTFWPLWLAEDLDGISVYTLAYEAPASNWTGLDSNSIRWRASHKAIPHRHFYREECGC